MGSIASHACASIRFVVTGFYKQTTIDTMQAMFMRLRSHTCAYCLTIDEAHYKRHAEIAEQLRTVYESCGEIEWVIIPSDSDSAAAEAAGDSDNFNGSRFEIDRTNGSDDTPSSKRERKDAKNLARAAGRTKAITQEEVQYIDSVIHSVDGMTSQDSGDPRNPEEVEDIEKQLRVSGLASGLYSSP